MAAFHVNIRGRSLLGTILIGIVAITLLAVLFFFLAAAAVAGAIIGAVVRTRLWWISRKLKKAAAQEILTTEYTVIEPEPAPQQRLPNEAQSGDRPPEAAPGDSDAASVNPRRPEH